MKICIDPGHGMSNRQTGVFDPGATHVENGFLFQEADLTLRYGLALKDAFRARQVDVFMTRDDNLDHAPVGRRAKAAEAAGCDVFISLHLNDFDDDSANGLEVLYGKDSSKELAKAVQAGLLKVTEMRDRKVKLRTDLAVLKFNGPAVLVELGFIANDKDRGKVIDPQVRDAIVNSIATVVLDHMGATA